MNIEERKFLLAYKSTEEAYFFETEESAMEEIKKTVNETSGNLDEVYYIYDLVRSTFKTIKVTLNESEKKLN